MRKHLKLSHDAGDFNRLPLDVWFQILSFLPAQSLLVLCAVCKSLLSVIQDHRFVSLHLRRFPHNLSETRFLTATSDGTAYQVRDGFSTFTQFTEPRLQTGNNTGSWDLAGSLDGLFLLVNTRFVGWVRRTVLWNPSIRKLRQLTLPAPEARHLGLGFDPKSKDYKVVAMSGYSYNGVWVYSVKWDLWTDISNTGFGRRFRKSVYSQSLAFDNGVFWIECCSSRKLDKNGLVWFGFETEKFRYANVPYSVDPKGRRTGSRLVTLDGGSSVGVCGVDAERQGYIWALEMETMSWTIRYKIDRRVLPSWTGLERVRFVERNGELVWKYWTSNTRSVKVLSYDIAKEAIKGRRKEFTGQVEDCLGVYFESVVML